MAKEAKSKSKLVIIFFKSPFNKLKIKGIHSGKVIAGVIGYHKPQFSLIGDTVNTTSRVCSTGEESMITISEEAMLETRTSEFHFRKKVAKAKGKGNLITFQVDRADLHKGLFRTKMTSALQTLKSRRAAENDENKNKNQTNLLLKILNFLQGKQNTSIEGLTLKIPKNNISNLEESPENSPNLALVKQEIEKELNKKNSKSFLEQGLKRWCRLKLMIRIRIGSMRKRL